ncbi:MAG: hypothetical protein IRY92_03070 [Dactylosporangium sp.]|nr:hypothetical protein [Dactylosporangium sp.]
MMASDPLAAELIRIAQSKNTSDADKIKAINSVLDRAEVRAGLDVSLKEDPKYIQILKDLFNESEEDDSEPGPGPEPTPSTSDDDVVDRLLKDVDPDADPTHAPYRGQPVPLAEPELPYGPPPFGQYVPRSAYDRR